MSRSGGTVSAAALASGSAGNAFLVESDGCRLLVDAGLSVEAVERTLEPLGLHPRDLSSILLTHEHDDHARGAGPLSRAFGIPVYATAAAAGRAGIDGAAVTTFEMARPFEVGPFAVTAFPVPHDAAEPVGFALRAWDRQVTIATDLGRADEILDEHVARADLVFLEANYDLRLLSVSDYPWFLKNRILSGRGHLSNDDAARVLARAAARSAGARPRAVYLVHLSEVNNLPALARDTVRAALAALADPAGADRVRVVPPNGGTGRIVLD